MSEGKVVLILGQLHNGKIIQYKNCVLYHDSVTGKYHMISTEKGHTIFTCEDNEYINMIKFIASIDVKYIVKNFVKEK